MKLSEFAKECRDTWKEDRSGVPVVGLEHLEPGEVKLSVWDVNSENTFTKRFNKGQVLLGRRRVYLRKAVVAPFDGICSGDITVIEAIPGKILPELLPFVIQNDAFFDYAEQGSAGSLSPRVKWEHLKDFEVNLPPIDEQKVLAEKLWAAYRLKESYKKLLAATDEMVKSRFIEMFGTISDPKVSVKRLIDVVEKSGQYGSNTPATDYISNTPRYIRITDINDDGSLNNDVKSPSEIDSKYMLIPGDVVFARTGATVGKTYLHKAGHALYAGYLIKYHTNNAMLPDFLFAFTHSAMYKQWIAKTQKIGAQPNISATQYDSMPILVPSIAEQMKYVELYNQADKSGFELRKSIENIDSVIKSLINN
jgi:type I restriction enzyme S subunit